MDSGCVVEWSLPTPEVHGSNLDIGNYYSLLPALKILRSGNIEQVATKTIQNLGHFFALKLSSCYFFRVLATIERF